MREDMQGSSLHRTVVTLPEQKGMGTREAPACEAKLRFPHPAAPSGSTLHSTDWQEAGGRGRLHWSQGGGALRSSESLLNLETTGECSPAGRDPRVKGGGPGWLCSAGCCGHRVLGELPDPPSTSALIIRGSRSLLSLWWGREKGHSLCVVRVHPVLGCSGLGVCVCVCTPAWLGGVGV